ncbi:right-handed parallel beta-helix repeat-containing protein [Catenulispora yoronensis]
MLWATAVLCEDLFAESPAAAGGRFAGTWRSVVRSRPIVFGAVCAVVASFDVAAPGLAHAASVIHVRQVSGCSDTAANAGSDAVPYCSISAAVSVVQPGQEVEVGEGTYKESVTVSRSGTPQAPIVIAAEPDTLVYLQNFIDNAHSGPVPLKLDHVHDVTVRGLRVQGSEQDAVLVDGSSDVVLDHLFASGGDSTSSVEVTGGSSNVTLSRSNLGGYEAPAVLVHGGSRDTTITTNNLGLGQDGIVVDGATGTVVTSNTVWKLKGSSVVLKNGATGSTVENNVLIPPRTAKPATDTPVFSVDAASAPNTVADYNTVQAGAGYAAYSWAGAVQHTQETFTQASGQGTHDIVQIGDEQNGGWPSYLAVEGDSRIDSANVAAPGELPSDIDGVTALDDPRVRNTGTGSGYRDRGAYEFKDPLASGDISLVPAAAPIGVPVTIKVNPSVGWSKNLTYTFTFDDDNPTTVSGPDSTVQHTFTTVGRRTVRYRVTDDLGAETPGSVCTSRPVRQATRSSRSCRPARLALSTTTAAGPPYGSWSVCTHRGIRGRSPRRTSTLAMARRSKGLFPSMRTKTWTRTISTTPPAPTP